MNTQTEMTDECREAFEVELRHLYPSAIKLRGDDGKYIGHMEVLWKFFQSIWNRRAHLTKPDAGGGEAVGNGEWFALVMGAAASLEDASIHLHQHDPDSAKLAMGAANHVRDRCNELWNRRINPTPVQTEQSLEVLGYLYSDGFGTHYTEDVREVLDGYGIESHTTLTDHAKATAALAQKDAEIAELKLEISVSDRLQRERIATLRARLNEETP